jgi:hypothetical protein
VGDQGTHLLKTPFIEKEVNALASGQFPLRVLGFYAFLTAALGTLFP